MSIIKKVSCLILSTAFVVSCTKSLEKTESDTKIKAPKNEVEAAKNEESAASSSSDAAKKTAQASISVKAKKDKEDKTPKKGREDMNTWNIQLEDGTVKIKLRPDLAPNHVERIKKLTEAGFYDGLKFHRVIDGFMAQTGDPNGDGTGGSDLPDLKAEFSEESFERGTVGMARAQDPNSANSQFFIMFADAPHLNGQYTVVGQVTEGMNHVDQLKKGPANENGAVPPPADKMVKTTLSE